MVATLLTAEPNPSHWAMAELEASGCLKAIITQNIDNLYQRAGAHEVLELHGHVRDATCINCYQVVSAEKLLHEIVTLDEVPRCALCNGVMKPNVVLFDFRGFVVEMAPLRREIGWDPGIVKSLLFDDFDNLFECVAFGDLK